VQVGLPTFLSPGGSTNTAKMAEALGFQSLVFADTRNPTRCLAPDISNREKPDIRVLGLQDLGRAGVL